MALAVGPRRILPEAVVERSTVNRRIERGAFRSWDLGSPSPIGRVPIRVVEGSQSVRVKTFKGSVRGCAADDPSGPAVRDRAGDV